MRLYFHLQDKQDVIRDLQGVEVFDLIEARAQALLAIKEVRHEVRAAAEEWTDWVLTVADADGTVHLAMELACVR